MNSFSGFTLTDFGSPWPSGNFVDVASIDVECKDVEKLISVKLFEGFEEGMGPWKAVGIKLDYGDVVELIRYAYDPEQAFALRVDAGGDFSRAISCVLALLGRGAESVKSINPLLDWEGPVTCKAGLDPPT